MYVAMVYTHHEQFRKDVRLLHSNSLLYNGATHLVTVMASNLVTTAERELKLVCYVYNTYMYYVSDRYRPLLRCVSFPFRSILCF